MFIFKIKAASSDIDVPAVRSLLGFALIVIMLYRTENIFALNVAVAAILLAALLFAEALLVKFRVNTLLLMTIAAILVFIATHALAFSIALILFAMVIKFSYINPFVEISEKGIRIRRTFSNKSYQWQSFNNIVLKDKLLTLDFKNNKLLQLELGNNEEVNEKKFNEFCSYRIVA